jgi:hypothetical protein
MSRKAEFRRPPGEEFQAKEAESYPGSTGDQPKEADQPHKPEGVGNYPSDHSALLHNRNDFTLAVLFIVGMLVCLFILAYA